MIMDNNPRKISEITKGSINKMITSLYKLENNDFLDVRPIIYLGPKQINQWIFDNLVSKTLKASLLIDYFKSKIQKVTPNTYFRNYKVAVTLMNNLIKLITHKSNQIDQLLLQDERLINQALVTINFSEKELVIFKIIISCYRPDLRLDWGVIRKKTQMKTDLDHPVICRHLKTFRHTIKFGSIQKRKLAYFLFFNWLSSAFKKFQKYNLNLIPIEDIQKDHLHDYCSYLTLQVSTGLIAASYANYNQTYILSFFQDLYKEGRISEDITINIDKIDYERYIYRDIPTDSEIEKLYEVICIYSPEPKLYSLAFDFMLYMGLRKSEVASIQWNDINVFTGVIIIHSKGGKDHPLPIPSNIVQKLMDYYKLDNTGYVFSEKPEEFAQNLYDYYKIFSEIAGWKYPGGLHLLRHTFITKLSREKNCSIQLQQLLSRHDKTETNAKYIHRSDDELLHAVNQHTIFREEDTKLIPFIHGNLQLDSL